MSPRVFQVAFLVSILAGVSAAPGTASVIRGRVLDSNNKPIAAAQVRIQPQDQKGLLRTAEATGSGVYIFRELPAGNYELMAFATGFAETSVGHIQLGSDQTLTIPSFELKTGRMPIADCSLDDGSIALDLISDVSENGGFQGVVRGAGGQPVSGAVITLVDLGSARVTRTDDAGRFSFSSLKPQHNYAMEISSSNFFTERVKDISVQAGFITKLQPFTLEPCKAGYCKEYLKEVRVLPGCS